MMMNNDYEIIAKFMDWQLCTCGVGEPHYKYGELIYEVHYFEDMDFHTSWNKLMLVIEKIEGLDFIGKVSIQYYTLMSGMGVYSVQIGRDSETNKYPDSFPIEVQEFIEEGNTSKTKLETTYKAVVEFIKWYNKINIER